MQKKSCRPINYTSLNIFSKFSRSGYRILQVQTSIVFLAFSTFETISFQIIKSNKWVSLDYHKGNNNNNSFQLPSPKTHDLKTRSKHCSTIEYLKETLASKWLIKLYFPFIKIPWVKRSGAKLIKKTDYIKPAPHC